MDEIRKLQQQLQLLQQSSHKRLSHSNCVDVVMILMSMNKIELYVSSDGFVTPKRLDEEIDDALSGGRINVVDLPKLCGVTTDVISTFVETKVNNGTALQSGGNLMHPSYLDTVAVQINNSLQDHGYLSLSFLANKFSLPTEFIRNLILHRLSDKSEKRLIDGFIKESTLYADRHITRVQAVVRGIIRTSPNPVNLKTDINLIYNYSLDLIIETVQKLLNDKIVKGKLQGNIFTPKGYLNQQLSEIKNYFSANLYVTTTAIKNSGLSNVNLESAIALKDCWIHESLIDRIKISVSEILQNEGFVDISVSVPHVFTKEDIQVLTPHLHFPAGIHHFQDSFLFLESTIQTLVTKFDEDIKTAASNPQPPSPEKKSKKNKESSTKQCVSDERIENVIINEGFPDDVVSDLMAVLKPMIAKRFTSEIEQLKRTIRSETSDQLAELSSRIQTHFDYLSATIKGIQNIGIVNSIVDWLKNPLAEILDDVLTFKVIELQLAKDEKVKQSNRKKYVERINKHLKKPIDSLLELCNVCSSKTNDVTAIAGSISKLEKIITEDCGIYIKSSDKKKDKSLLHNRREILHNFLSYCADKEYLASDKTNNNSKLFAVDPKCLLHDLLPGNFENVILWGICQLLLIENFNSFIIMPVDIEIFQELLKNPKFEDKIFGKCQYKTVLLDLLNETAQSERDDVSSFYLFYQTIFRLK
eukprot:GHVL01021748.1.p1 GENE.GHVL01021748.1~~GHVL01021748.1.p1  ORF type:complete len:700 (+),score=134.22 GHVL01021748.1:36-2135(+)